MNRTTYELFEDFILSNYFYRLNGACNKFFSSQIYKYNWVCGGQKIGFWESTNKRYKSTVLPVVVVLDMSETFFF